MKRPTPWKYDVDLPGYVTDSTGHALYGPDAVETANALAADNDQLREVLGVAFGVIRETVAMGNLYCSIGCGLCRTCKAGASAVRFVYEHRDEFDSWKLAAREAGEEVK